MSTATIRAYWPLIKSVIVPLGIIKVILIVVGVSFVLMFVVAWFLQGEAKSVAPVFLMVLFLYFFFIVILLPSQALTVISSKSLRYVTDFRKFYFLVAFLLALAFPLMMIFFQWIMADPTKAICAEGFCAEFNSTYSDDGVKRLIHTALQVWLLSSSLLAGLFFATYRLPILLALIFMIFVFLKPIFQQLSQLGFLQLFIALILIWFVFGLWLLRLKPQKYIMNNYGMSMGQMMAAGTTANPAVRPQGAILANFFTAGVKPASLLGTRLLGSPDGKAVVIPFWIYIFAIGLLYFLYMKWSAGDNFENVHFVCIYSSLLLLCIGATTSLNALCRNIKPLWLFYPGTRKEMFLFVERKSLVYAATLISIAPVYSIVFYQLADADIPGVATFGGIMLSSLLFVALVFYISLTVYARDKDSKLGFSGWQVISGLVGLSLITLICYLWINADYMPALIIDSVVLAILLVLRNYLIKKWQTINFVKVS
jgi:hypothetical protein